MKEALGLIAACLGVFAAFLLQQALPAIHFLHGARFVFVPAIFCYAAMALPFSAMLVAAFFTGLLSDLMYLHVAGGRVEIALGCSIVFFVILGSIANGLRPSFRRGIWWPSVLIAAVGTSGYLLMQFAMISFRREGLVFDPAVLWRIFAPGVIAALLVPILHATVAVVGSFLPGAPIEPRRLR